MNVNVEFLETYKFKKERFPDGLYWIRRYTSDYILHVNEALDKFYEEDGDWVEELTSSEFVATIMRHEQAINQ